MKNQIIYGGWRIIDPVGRNVRLVTKCEGPDMARYRENLKARKSGK
mgnify:CR=1 FL=1